MVVEHCIDHPDFLSKRSGMWKKVGRILAPVQYRSEGPDIDGILRRACQKEVVRLFVQKQSRTSPIRADQAYQRRRGIELSNNH